MVINVFVLLGGSVTKVRVGIPAAPQYQGGNMAEDFDAIKLKEIKAMIANIPPEDGNRSCQFPTDRVEKVKEIILAAFPETAPPAAVDLIFPCFSEKNRESMKRTELNFMGRTWGSLTPEFLEQNWASYCYFSRHGYRYYLPAKLLRALEPQSGHSFQHAVVSGLKPGFWELYYNSGKDLLFEEHLALFSETQFKAVAAFLELFFDAAPRFKFLSAQVLRWGWDRMWTPALAKALEYYHELHNYDWPQAPKPEALALVERIKTVFKDTPPPKPDEMCNTKQGDEPAEYAMEFRGLDWRRLHPDFLNREHACLSFFPAPAFRYFLPAYLVQDLTDTLTAQADLISQLTWTFNGKKEKPELHTYMLKQFSKFNKAERGVITAYLEYKAACEPFQLEVIKTAIRLYWNA